MTVSLIAIDVLLDPDQTMVERASAANARLRGDFPAGFALDADHAPHITVLQRFVRTADLDAVEAAVAAVIAQVDLATLELDATGYYYLPWQNLGVPGITVAATPTLLDLQQSIIAAVAPFSEPGGGPSAFVGTPDTPTILPTAAYVETFVPDRVGTNYNPHVTVGVGHEEFVKSMLAEPFERFVFTPVRAAIYQLGDLGTAQKELWSSIDGRA
jgi:hypothetical protein